MGIATSRLSLKRLLSISFSALCGFALAAMLAPSAGAQAIATQGSSSQQVPAQNVASSSGIPASSEAPPASNSAIQPAGSSTPLSPDAIQLDPADPAQPGHEAGQPDSSEAFEHSHAAMEPLEDESAVVLDPASLLPDLPPVPPGKASLIGGTVDRLDRVRDQITVHPFGGGKMVIAFDPRTRIYRGSEIVSTSDLHKGDRVYVDTILDGSVVFAKNIRLKTSISAGNGQGTVLSYRSGKSELLIRDALSPEHLRVRVTPQTRVLQGSRAVSAGQLVPGTLVEVKFAPRQDGVDVAREVSILAVPGASFTFAGKVEALDLRLGLLVLTSLTDHKTYEIHLDPSLIDVEDNLKPGVEVTAETKYDGKGYVARRVILNAPASQ